MYSWNITWEHIWWEAVPIWQEESHYDLPDYLHRWKHPFACHSQLQHYSCREIPLWNEFRSITLHVSTSYRGDDTGSSNGQRLWLIH